SVHGCGRDRAALAALDAVARASTPTAPVRARLVGPGCRAEADRAARLVPARGRMSERVRSAIITGAVGAGVVLVVRLALRAAFMGYLSRLANRRAPSDI